MTIVSEIKLIRTDPTLDLSQKAEKVCLVIGLDSLMLPDAQRALWGSNPIHAVLQNGKNIRHLRFPRGPPPQY